MASSRAGAWGEGGWPPGRIFAGVTGAALVARALLGRGLARLPLGVAGVAILRRAFPARAPAVRGSGGASARRAAARPPGGPEVIEVKSPAELEPGVASGSPRPTFEDRVDRGERVESQRTPRDPGRR